MTLPCALLLIIWRVACGQSVQHDPDGRPITAMRLRSCRMTLRSYHEPVEAEKESAIALPSGRAAIVHHPQFCGE